MRTAWRPAALLACLVGIGMAAAASAQDRPNPFGSFKHDNSQPIEITADALEVREAEKRAIFSGSVIAGQGVLRLTADTLIVWYRDQGAGNGGGGGAGGTGDIDRLRAEGDVFLSSGAETARGAWADYDVLQGVVTMGGGVTLSQGENAIRGDRLTVNLTTGVGRVEGGRVQSVFNPASRTGQ
jgi:lipopolysaccharide export system protein LptA